MQSELVGHGSHLLGSRPVQPDPGHAAMLAEGFERLLQALGLGTADAVNIDGVIDNGHVRSSILDPSFCLVRRRHTLTA